MTRADPVVLAQRGEHHGADRHVDADAEGVGAADHLEQPGLGKGLDQAPVARQHAGVVDADAVAHQPRQRLAEPGREPEAADQLGDGVLLLAGADVDAHQRLGALERRGLGEVHDVDRRLAGRSRSSSVSWTGVVRVVEVQRDRPVRRADHGRRSPGTPRQVRLEARHVAERRRHEEELRARQLEERHLPRPAAVGVGVEVELVHHDDTDVGVGALAQRDVGQDLGRAVMIGASALTEASPVSMPTFSAPNASHRSKNFSDTSALIGAV